MQAFMPVFSLQVGRATIEGMEEPERHPRVHGAAGYPARGGSGMAKRLMLAVVGAGIGSLAGLLVSFLGVGNSALIAGAVAGAVIPLVALGPPGR